jgi:putative MATE family efflux protein
MIVRHEDARRALWRLGAPNALALIADQLLGIADTIVIGVLGTAALAGISAATSVFVILAIGLWAFPNAARILGAQALGAGDPPLFGSIVRSSALAPIAISAGVAILSFVAAGPLMHAMLGGIPSRDEAAGYLTLRCVSLVPIAISSHAIAAFGTAGDTRLAPRTLFAINLVHIPLLLVLALGIGTHHPFGLLGAGTSSLLSECVGAAYCVWMTRSRREYRILDTWTIDIALARTAFALAVPEFVMLVMLLVPDAVTVAFLAPFGATTVAAFRAFTLVTDLTWAVPGSFGDAIGIVVGQRLGAGDLPGARRFFEEALRLAVRTGTLVGIVIAILAWPLTALVTLSPALADIAALPLALHMCTLPIKSYAAALLAPIRAEGDTRFSMWNGIIGAGVAVALIAFFTHVVPLGLYAIGLSWIVSWSARSLQSWKRLYRPSRSRISSWSAPLLARISRPK